MKKHLSVFTLLVCLALLLQACSIDIGGNSVRGSGNVVTEDRPVSGVKRVTLANQGDLKIQVGAAESLVIEAEENLLPYIETNVRGGQLEIRTQNGTDLQNTRPIRYTLTVTELDGVTITSSGGISASDMRASSFSILVSSSGKLDIASLYADKLDVEITSSGNVAIKTGEVPQIDIRISSSGDLDVQHVAAQKVSVVLSSSGAARVWVSDTLDGRLTSSGNVYYRGSPQVNVTTSSSGKAINTGN
jgi:Putative auto-transporter adhesin, head GIN domain